MGFDFFSTRLWYHIVCYCLILYHYIINKEYTWHNVCSTWFLGIRIHLSTCRLASVMHFKSKWCLQTILITTAINSPMGGQTDSHRDTHTYRDTNTSYVQRQSLENMHVPGLWFTNSVTDHLNKNLYYYGYLYFI